MAVTPGKVAGRGTGTPNAATNSSLRVLGPRLAEFVPEACAALAAVALYARTLGFGLVFDDHSLIDTAGPRALGSEWLPYRPVRFASLWLDARIGGGEAWAYHASNVLLHAAAAALVVRLGRRAGASGSLALACALPFVAHPLAVEAVAYVAGRRDLLCAVFGLAALAAWAGHRSAAAIVLVLLAVGAKEIGILFVALLLVASLAGIGLPVRHASSPLVLTALAALALPVAYGAHGPLAPQGSFATKLYLAGAVAAHYVENLLAPAALSVEYPVLRCSEAACPAVGASRSLAGLVIVLVAAVTSGGALMAAMRWRPRASAGAASSPAQSWSVPAPAAWFRSASHAARIDGEAWRTFTLVWIATWLVALSLVVGGHEPGADRHAYVLIAALAVAMAAYAVHASERVQHALAAAAVGWAAVLALGAYGRIDTWRDDLALWESALASAPSSARVHHNLAAALADRGRYARAHRHLSRAIDIDPSYWPPLLGFAGIDCERGRLAAARMRIDEARALGAPASEVAAVQRRCDAVAHAR
jgi:Tfp pilus assembly protein PilF